MNKNPLFKYKVGLLVVGVFTLILTGMVLVQAHATKQDADTDTKANSIAEKLNSYVESKQTIPKSLSEAGINDVPSTISYSAVSATSYKFCVTYKSNSSNFDPSSVGWSLATGGSVGSSGFGGSSSKTYLYIPTQHKKGQNCQTISPLLYGGGTSCGYFCNYPDSSSSNNNFLNDLGGSATSADDTKRKTDINSLMSYIEAAYATNGYYPTLAELNSSTWRAANMKGLDASALCDPSAKTSSCAFTSTPQKGSYSYAPTTDSGTACTTSGECQNYVLTATLSKGSTYKKSYP